MTNRRTPTDVLLILFGSMLIAVVGCSESDPTITKDEGTKDVTVEQPTADGTAGIRGLLVDQGTKKTLGNTRVKLVDSQGMVRDALTSQAGVFEFGGLPSGEKFTVVVELDEYEKHETVVNPIGAGETERITVNLVSILMMEDLPPGDGLSVGSKAPNFNLKDGDGKAHSLANYAGKTTCGIAIGSGRVVTVLYAAIRRIAKELSGN